MEPKPRPALVVRRWGQGSPVLLVHGSVVGGHASWAALKPLAARRELIVPNRRGYHPSPPTSQEDFEVDTADLSSLIDRPVHLIGHSYGAAVALRLAVSKPTLIRSLTLIEPPPPPQSHYLAHVKSWVEQMTQLQQTGPEDPADLLAEFMRMVGGPGTSIPVSPQIANQIELFRGSRPVWQSTVDVTSLTRTATPSLVISGGHSPVFESGCDVLAEMLGGDRAIIPGGGHFVQSAAGFLEVVETFLNTAEERATEQCDHLIQSTD